MSLIKIDIFQNLQILNVNLDVVEPLPLACLPAVSDSWFGERASEASGISYIKNKKKQFHYLEDSCFECHKEL